MRTTEQIIRDKDSATLRAILADIETLHKQGSVGEGPFRNLKREIEAAGFPKESSLILTEKVALGECARRWAEFSDDKPSEALFQIARTAGPEGDEIQVEISAEGNHIRLAMPMDVLARAVTGEAHLPVEVRRWAVVRK